MRSKIGKRLDEAVRGLNITVTAMNLCCHMSVTRVKRIAILVCAKVPSASNLVVILLSF